MQAIRITPGGGVAGLAMVELPDPRPGPGEVVVRVRATSLNYRDLGIARAARDGIIPLSDGAGEVAAIGEGVTRFAVGDRVDAQITTLDKAARRVSLSIKAMEIKDEKEAVEQYGSADSGASLGDILGAALKGAKKDE